MGEISRFYTVGVCLLTGTLIVIFLKRFNRVIVLREIIALYSVICYLLMPLLGYYILGPKNALSVKYDFLIAVPYEVYFDYAFWALLSFCSGLFFLGIKESKDWTIRHLNIIKCRLEVKRSYWKILFFVGIVCFILRPTINLVGINYILFLGYFILFVSIVYLYFTPGQKNKYLWFGIFTFLIISEAVTSSMFTVILYSGILLASLLFLNRPWSFPMKSAAFVMGLLLIYIIQVTKATVRFDRKMGRAEEINVNNYWSAFKANLRSVGYYDKQIAFFPIYLRMNQGYNLSLVMSRIPRLQEYDGGTSILSSVLSSITPRIFWKDKPRAGGEYNMAHFAGRRISGWSTNIGPVGEAYGNFGPAGGIGFMFLFGLFINRAYNLFIRISEKVPLIYLWSPLLFFELVYCMENDILQALNSIIKSGLFVIVVYLLFPFLFKAGSSTAHPGPLKLPNIPH